MSTFSSTNYAKTISEPPVNLRANEDGARVRVHADAIDDTFASNDYAVLRKIPDGMKILGAFIPAGTWDLVSLDDDGNETSLVAGITSGLLNPVDATKDERLALKDSGAGNGAVAANVTILFSAANS